MIKDKLKEQARPVVLLKMYETLLELALPGLTTQLKKSPRAFEAAFDYWLDNSIKEALKSQDIIPSNHSLKPTSKEAA